MARIRTIKPQFWGDDKISELSRDARLVTIGLISMADDEGRFIASTKTIDAYIFPHDDIPARQLNKWLDEIEDQGIIRRYKIGRREYGQFPNYSAHQRISKPQESPLPPPPVAEPFHTQSRNQSTTDTGVIPQGNGMEGEWNGMEKESAACVRLPAEPDRAEDSATAGSSSVDLRGEVRA